MRRRDGGAYVALLPDGTVIGYITFAFSSKAFRIVNLAVHPDYRRLGVGAKLVDKLKAKLNRPEMPTRFTISLYITTENLVGLSFFKSQKFRAISEIVGRYPNAPEKAAYLLIYRDLPSVKLDPAYAAHRPTS
jgi:ribosomal protein S18 acetylase RimI-like enzyme